MTTTSNIGVDLSNYALGWSDEEDYVFKPRRGLDSDIVREMSFMKKEPEWMLDFRLKSLNRFERRPLPTWGGELGGIDFDNIYYYIKPTEEQVSEWDEVPDSIKNTYERLGIPEAERKYLAGVTAQYESEVVYHRNREDLEAQGVIFSDMDSAVREHPDLVRKHFGRVIPPNDNKFSALNSAVWSGGSFIYVPPGVSVELPLQAYFRINAENMGQFERTLIIADEGSRAHYIEGCTAPVYSTESFHSGVIEIVVKPGAHFRYTTIQNWSNNMYNLVTQRSLVHENATMEWLDGNLGSKLTMKYPSCFLVGERAHGSILSIAYAGNGQHQDTGGKVIHAAPGTSSSIVSKSISKGSGRASYRGLCKVYEGSTDAKSNVECDALLIDEAARTDTYPYIEIDENQSTVGHEARVSKVGEEQIFYLMSRGMPEEEAMALIVRGFIEPIARQLPLEYAVELNRLIELEMEGSVG